ncbi:MAG TPA: hypothetical protein P5142_18050 [Spirochaetia bacterium]|nr:hypothetical protein [Spirochaetia bacterium]
MDGTIDSVTQATQVPAAVDPRPQQEAPETSPASPESPPVAEESGKTLDLYV